MNTKHNKRRRDSIKKMETAFVELLQGKALEDISVTEICKKANVNRTTFYANYLDIYDLVDKIGEKMLADFYELYEEEETSQQNTNDFLKLFQHIKNNQLFYKTYFKLGLNDRFKPMKYDTNLAEEYYHNEHIDYHMEFFRAGITAIIQKWLNEDCQISPEELFDILKNEYKKRN